MAVAIVMEFPIAKSIEFESQGEGTGHVSIFFLFDAYVSILANI